MLALLVAALACLASTLAPSASAWLVGACWATPTWGTSWEPRVGEGVGRDARRGRAPSMRAGSGSGSAAAGGGLRAPWKRVAGKM